MIAIPSMNVPQKHSTKYRSSIKLPVLDDNISDSPGYNNFSSKSQVSPMDFQYSRTLVNQPSVVYDDYPVAGNPQYDGRSKQTSANNKYKGFQNPNFLGSNLSQKFSAHNRLDSFENLEDPFSRPHWRKKAYHNNSAKPLPSHNSPTSKSHFAQHKNSKSWDKNHKDTFLNTNHSDTTDSKLHNDNLSAYGAEKGTENTLTENSPSFQAEAYHIPDYVNQDNLPFKVGTNIYDSENDIEYKLLNVLGEGSYAVVYLARNLRDDSLRALKCLSSFTLSESQLKLQKSEIELHKFVSGGNKHIVNLYYTFNLSGWTFLVMELVTGSDLYDHIVKHPSFGVSNTKQHHYLEAIRLFEQMIEAVSHLHSLRVYHRDLKPENFIIDPNGNLKLTDFGLATTECSSTEFEFGSKPYMSYENRNGGINQDDVTIYGYNETYSPRLSDVWALGVLLLNLLFAECPWQDPCTESCFRFCDFLRGGSRFLTKTFGRLPKKVADFLVNNVFCPERQRCNVLTLKMWVSDLKACLESELGNTSVPNTRTGPIAVPQPSAWHNKKKMSPFPKFDAQSHNYNRDARHNRVDQFKHGNHKGSPVASKYESQDVFNSVPCSVPADVFTNVVSRTKAVAVNYAMPRENYYPKHNFDALFPEKKAQKGKINNSSSEESNSHQQNDNRSCRIKSKNYQTPNAGNHHYYSRKPDPFSEVQYSSSYIPNSGLCFSSKNDYSHDQNKHWENKKLSHLTSARNYDNHGYKNRTPAVCLDQGQGQAHHTTRPRNNGYRKNTLSFLPDFETSGDLFEDDFFSFDDRNWKKDSFYQQSKYSQSNRYNISSSFMNSANILNSKNSPTSGGNNVSWRLSQTPQLENSKNYSNKSAMQQLSKQKHPNGSYDFYAKKSHSRHPKEQDFDVLDISNKFGKMSVENRTQQNQKDDYHYTDLFEME
ncbi:hypothetical protein BB560_002686 [Smittium megazygosporum]|uniref:Protein kinase domain-containing protein n=1 Tax=Smittium megazygosporum TaxID=133381 RepID=A0A2T9ZE78_9FUNG|nr:hypothetical protein BB560_002686 [Smittium megazygosporum]